MKERFQYRRSRVFARPEDPVLVEKVARQGACPAHEHDFIEVMLAVNGSGIQETAASHRPVRRGTLTVLRTGHWHAYSRCRGLALYNCCFGPELLRHELAWLLDDPKLARMLWGSGQEPLVLQVERRAVADLSGILDGLRGRRGMGRGIMISRLAVFLTTLSALLPEPRGEAVPALVRQSLLAMEKELARPWTVRELAAKHGCSPEYLIRTFKDTVGVTPYAYLSRCRAERAATLLLEGTAPLAEIGRRVGWPEPCHFSRKFRQFYGKTAREFRSRPGADRPRGI